MDELGNNLRRLMGLHALSARHFVSLVPLSSQAISEIINGKRRPSLNTAQMIAHFFEVPLERLLSVPFTGLLAKEVADIDRYERVEGKIPRETR